MRVVQRSCGVNALVEQEELRRAAAGTGRLPSVPRIYAELMTLIASPDATLHHVQRVPRRRPGQRRAARVEQDAALAAKVLQLANSAFFGRSRTGRRRRAGDRLPRAHRVKALTLSAEVLAAFAPERHIPGFSIERLQSHSLF